MASSKASSALLERVAALARSQFGEEDHYLATTVLGSALSEQHLEILSESDPDRLSDPQSARALFEITQLVDCVQDGSPRLVGPARNEGFVSDAFLSIVDAVDFATTPLDVREQARLDQAQAVLYEEPPFLKTEAYTQFCILRSDIEQKEIVLLELRRQLDIAEGDKHEQLVQDEEALAATLEGQRELLQALDRQHGFSEAEKIRDRAGRRVADFPRSVKDSLAVIDLFRITDASSNASHLSCDFFPAGLAEDNWVPLRLTRSEITQSRADSPLLSAIQDIEGLEFVDDGLIESIELELQMLAVQRSWFWPELFENRQWRFSVPSEPVSKGRGSSDGLMPAYVAGLVFARDLVVRATEEAEGRAPAPSGAMVGNLAPAVVLGRNPQFVAVQGRSVAAAAMHARPMAAAPVRMAVAQPQIRRGAIQPQIQPHVRRQIQPQFQPHVRPQIQPQFQPQVRPQVQRELQAQLVAQLKRTIPVRGRITDASGRSLAGATIVLRQIPNGPVQTKQTAKDGSFSFLIVGGGNCSFTISKPGFKELSKGFIINQPFTANLTLEAEGATEQLTVRLVDQTGAPFKGDADIVIHRIPHFTRQHEQMRGTSEARIPLPKGRYSVSVSSSEARRIEPPTATVELNGAQTITFEIQSSVLVRIPEIQLLGLVCRQVPLSPDPDPTLFGA